MFDMGIILIHLALASVTIWITQRYLSILFKRKKLSLSTALLWITFFLFQFWIEGQKEIGFLWIAVINIVLQIFIAYTAYEGKIIRKFFCVILLYVIWAMVEMLTYFILVLIPLGNQEFSILGSVVSKLVAILLINVLHIWYKGKQTDNMPKKYFLLLLVMPVCCAFIATDIFYTDDNYGQNALSLISFSLLLIINIAIFEIYYRLSMNLKLEKENLIFEQQIQLLTKHNEEQQRMQEEFAELRHNLKNQLIVLKSEIEHGDNEAVLSAIDDMMEYSVKRPDEMIHSGNDLVDAVINNKYTAAKEEEIRFCTKIFIPMELPVSQSDLGILLGNALDNAIEAARQCSGEKQIEISMGIKKQALVIVIRNPYIHETKTDAQGNYTTTKEEKKNHGYGLYSIKKIVKKYDGDLTIDAKEHIFTLTAILNI